LTSVDAVSGMAPLHFAARSGAANIGDDERAAKVVAQLLNQGADINQRCHYASMTPLHYAALYGCPWVITELSRTRPYRSAVDLNAVILEDHGGSSYHLAVIGGHPEVIRALLAAGADHTRVNGAKHTPLEAALAHYESGAIERHDLATEEELRLIIELLKGVENRIPHGRWIDLQGEFCGGAVIEIRRDGTGVNEDTRQAITTTSLGDGRFYIQQDGDHMRNEHTRSGSILIGTAVTANGTKLPNHRHVGSSPLGRPRNGNSHGHDASRSMWQLQDVADLERARAEREKIEAERQRLRDEEARKAKAAADEQERLERERSVRERLEQEELEKLRAEQDESEKLRARLMPPPDDNHGDLDSRATTPSASPEKEWEPIYVGDRVLVNKKRVGLVRYKGPVDFLHGYILYGIELEKPEGKHNGTVGVRTYFRCRAGYGIFAKRPKLRLLDPLEDVDALLHTSQLHSTTPRNAPKRAPKVAPFSTTTLNPNRTKGLAVEAKSLEEYPEAYKRVKTRRLSQIAGGLDSPSMGRRSKSPGDHYRNATPFSPPKEEEVDPKKQLLVSIAKDFGVGSRVLVKRKTASRMGKVMFIGATHLGPGTYIGVELAASSDGGKLGSLELHTGTVDGREYFKTRTGRGVLVKASSVYWYSRKVSDLYPNP